MQTPLVSSVPCLNARRTAQSIITQDLAPVALAEVHQESSARLQSAMRVVRSITLRNRALLACVPKVKQILLQSSVLFQHVIPDVEWTIMLSHAPLALVYAGHLLVALSAPSPSANQAAKSTTGPFPVPPVSAEHDLSQPSSALFRNASPAATSTTTHILAQPALVEVKP